MKIRQIYTCKIYSKKETGEEYIEKILLKDSEVDE